MASTLTPATLVWDEEGQPFCPEFGDYYFSKHGGLDESRYVFLEGNALLERWANQERFVIGEWGFGTGLNLLAVWELFSTCEAPPKELLFVSFEGSPLCKEDMAQAHALWPSLAPYAAWLQEAYPPLVQGAHELRFGSLHVRLIFDHARRALPLFPTNVDAWFLDGFAPSKNAEMWEESLFKHLATCSNQGATFATFTAASKVRKGLEAVGFKVRKISGFGKKREMSVGEWGC
ncbi:MAG: tRNA (5-methylaminomethyl-2-thiouridine)(34)-methyltransferase MnmD [Campylobacterales bacterium]|nr:tRNA (5-methylaminomethyl-2-thiouridine)(34)-methyltransferase MnmD [Campylobacterales bacterium]